MDFKRWERWGAIHAGHLFLFLVVSLILAGILPISPVQADGGIGISGSFYRQVFQIPQGSSVSGPSIYVIIHNTGSEELRIMTHATAPDGVTVSLSDTGINFGLSTTDFVIAAGEQRQLMVAVEVASYVPPGNYEIVVSAEAYPASGGGLQILGSAAQAASLTVVGESASVIVDTAGPSGEPVVAVIRLFKVVDGDSYEFAYSSTGHLEAMVSPGHFRAEAYSNGEKLAEEEFDVANGDTRTLTLTIETIYFEGFAVNPGLPHPDS